MTKYLWDNTIKVEGTFVNWSQVATNPTTTTIVFTVLNHNWQVIKTITSTGITKSTTGTFYCLYLISSTNDEPLYLRYKGAVDGTTETGVKMIERSKSMG